MIALEIVQRKLTSMFPGLESFSYGKRFKRLACFFATKEVEG